MGGDAGKRRKEDGSVSNSSSSSRTPASRGSRVNLRDLRDFYTAEEVKSAEKALSADPEVRRRRRARGGEDVFVTGYPLKYLGIEVGRGSGDQPPRFPLETAVRISLRPRSMDGAASKGLRLSTHRTAFLDRFPDVDAALSHEDLFSSAPSAPLGSTKAFSKSEYASAAAPGLDLLRAKAHVPVRISMMVLRKGLAAYRSGHRPGMSAHGWARARLTSFVMKGCTHFFPDHTLVAKCPSRTHDMWSTLPCLCRKREQCGRPGVRTRSNAA